MTNIDDFNALWRASGSEATKYSDDFPECFLVLPELIDGSIAQGFSTKITISIELNKNKNTGILKVTDNGKGVTNIQRLLSWASKQSENTHNRYGHGSKKCLTKWNLDYNCKWYVKYRTCDKRKVSGSLFTYNGPFQGTSKKFDEDEHDENNLMPSGLEWCIEFNTDIFGHIKEPKEIFDTIKEILRTRYSKIYFDKTEFIIKIKKGDLIIEESSKDKTKNWKSFQEMVEDEVKNNNCVVLTKTEEVFNEIKMSYIRYFLRDESSDLVKNFSFYGPRRMKSSRLHIALSGRTIEIAPFWLFTKRETNHNDLNGHFGFVNFEGDFNKAPTPATTKVSFYENCDKYKKFIEIMKEHNKITPKEIEPIKKKKLEILLKNKTHKEDLLLPVIKIEKKKSKNLQIEYKEPTIFYKVIYFEIDNYDDFDEIFLKCKQIKKSIPITSNITKIDNLENNKGYNFIIEAKHKDINFKHEFDPITPNKEMKPVVPEIIKIDDSTHDIKINFNEPKDIGLPPTHIKIYINNKVPESMLFNKEIILPQQIHNETSIQISYINKIGESERTPLRKIKLEKCPRKEFTSVVKDKVLLNSDHKCSITGIRIDQHCNRFEIDHKNGYSCINTEENCQPLLVEIHSIKSNNPNLFQSLKDNKKDLFNYKIDRINKFLESLSNDDKKIIKFNNNTMRIDIL